MSLHNQDKAYLDAVADHMEALEIIKQKDKEIADLKEQLRIRNMQIATLRQNNER